MRVAIYARYSSDQQSAASIEDQLRICREQAVRDGFRVVAVYKDAAISGSSVILRPGIQSLLEDARSGQFDMVMAEALDRISRDQADVATLFKHMQFAGVPIVTLAEGEISELHVGLKGTMNALFLKDLAKKTHRGLRGRVENGKSGGGLCYGYDVVKRLNSEGDPVRGERTINAQEAAIVRRIFSEYLDGRSSRTIAMSLNREGVPGPQGTAWGPSTIHGNPKRGVGILNNELYVGKLVWNKLRYVKNPDTGRRVSRFNPESEWVTHDLPELRIIEQDVWNAVKERQKALAFVRPSEAGENPLNDRRRPKHLFAGLVRCGCCGGGYAMISKDLLGCAATRNKGTCDNRLNIRRDALETSILNGLRSHLMEPELFKAFCLEFTREVNRLRIERRTDQDAWRSELPKIEKQIQAIIEAIKAGMFQPSMKDAMDALEARKLELIERLANADDPPPLLHPNMAEIYRQRIAALYDRLQVDKDKAEAMQILRTLVDQVTLTPDGKELAIVLRGDLAAILTFAASKKKPDFLMENRLLQDLVSGNKNGDSDFSESPVSLGAGDRNTRSRRNAVQNAKTSAAEATEVSQLSLVAGAGFEPAAFRL